MISCSRKRTIKETLSRNAPHLDEWMTRGLVGSLKIPMAWVNEAKVRRPLPRRCSDASLIETNYQATHALSNGRVFQAYELYLSAGLYNAAHDLAVLELAPDAVIHRDLELLKELFERFAGRGVDDWHARGKVRTVSVRRCEAHAVAAGVLGLCARNGAHARAARVPGRRRCAAERRAGRGGGGAHAQRAQDDRAAARRAARPLGHTPQRRTGRDDRRAHAAARPPAAVGGASCTRPPFFVCGTDAGDTLQLGTHLRTAMVGEATKLHHIRATAYEKFLRTIEVL